MCIRGGGTNVLWRPNIKCILSAYSVFDHSLEKEWLKGEGINYRLERKRETTFTHATQQYALLFNFE